MNETFWLAVSDSQTRWNYLKRHLLHQAIEPYTDKRGVSLCGIMVSAYRVKFNPVQDTWVCKKCLAKAQPFIGSLEPEPGTPDPASQSQS
jgi:hypothetical protein